MINTLIVDDEPTVIKWLAGHMSWEDFGCQVCGSCLNGRDILDYMGSHPVDLLITDICMPDMDGLELIGRARKLNPRLRIIVISAHSNFTYAKEAIRLGVENYLLKPIDQDELAETLIKVRDNINENLNDQDMNVFKNNILNRWVKNTTLEYNFKTQAEVAEINLGAPSYLAVIVKPMAANMDPELLLSRLKDAAAKLDVSDCYFFIENRKTVTCILCGFSDDYKVQLTRLCGNMQQIKGQIGMPILFSVGMPVDRYTKLSLSYDAAIRYMTVIQMINSPILFCDDYLYSRDLDLAANLNMQKLRQLIHDKRTREALVQAKKILDGGKSNNQKKLITISIAANVVEAMDISNNDQYSIYLLQTLLKYRTLHANFELEDWLFALINTISFNISEYDSQMHPHVRHCISIIKKSFNNPELCLKNISDQLNLSSAYMGQLFKTQTGKYFNDFLADVRLDIVYRLLMETDERIGEIAEKSGFTSQSYMNRLFKRKFKLSPNEYRRLFRNT